MAKKPTLHMVEDLMSIEIEEPVLKKLIFVLLVLGTYRTANENK